MTALPAGRVTAEASGAPLAVRSVARSHVGLVRTINEDRVFDCPEARLWAVADGMGGHRGGDVAAQMVVDRLRALAIGDQYLDLNAMIAGLEDAHADIYRYNQNNGTDAGATVVAVVIVGDLAHVAWAGDSRAYRWRGGKFDLLTHDHSVVQELVDAGLLTEDAAARHPQSNVITRALGVRGDPRLETAAIQLEPGDILLLCSDGLSRSLDIAGIDKGEIESLSETLLAHSLSRDGTDNASLVLIELLD